MKLARNLTVALVAAVFVILATSSYFRVRRETGIFEADVRRDGHMMGRALAAAVGGVWRTEGEERALRVVFEANERESQVGIRWVWLDAPEGSPHRALLDPEALAPLRNGKEVVSKARVDDDDKLVTCVPVPVPAARVGALEISESLAGESEFVRTTVLNTLAATAGLTLVCGAMTSAVGVWLVGRPLRSLIAQARRVGEGDLTGRVEVRHRDEIGDLAAEMNRMCERLAAAHVELEAETGARIDALEQLRHAERLATIGKLASGIAHELGAPLQIVTGRAGMLADGELDREETMENGRILAEQSQRMARTIRQLLDFARRRTADKVSTDVEHLVRETCSLLEPLAAKKGVALTGHPPPAPLRVRVDPEHVRQALTNVIVNGIQALPGPGRVDVRVAADRAMPPTATGPIDCAVIHVCDDGPGMSEETVRQIFEPFFTTKPAGEGTGLGLSVALGIVRDHGGWIDVDSSVGAGTTFTLYLPMDRPS